MSAVFRKLNLKNQAEIVVLSAPVSFEPELAALGGIAVRRSLTGVRELSFALAFVTRQRELDKMAAGIAKLAVGDAVVWFAYPKRSSKNYTCEFDRDTGWSAIGRAGFEPVRMVAIDADWSALRFRRVEFIKSLTRDAKHALSAAGKKKAGAPKRRRPAK